MSERASSSAIFHSAWFSTALSRSISTSSKAAGATAGLPPFGTSGLSAAKSDPLRICAPGRSQYRFRLASGGPQPIIRRFLPPGRAESGGKMAAKPVAIIMGSQSDWTTMKHAAATLKALKIGHEALIVSAHRTPGRLYEFARNARKNGFKVIIAGAGGAAHLPGMAASMTPLPVFGVPMKTHALEGKDSL